MKHKRNRSKVLEAETKTEQQTIKKLNVTFSQLQIVSGFCLLYWSGLFPNILRKAPGQNWEKVIDLTSKLGEIKDIEHRKGSKIYPQNQVILNCIMPSIPRKHKCLSICLIRVIASNK